MVVTAVGVAVVKRAGRDDRRARLVMVFEGGTRGDGRRARLVGRSGRGQMVGSALVVGRRGTRG